MVKNLRKNPLGFWEVSNKPTPKELEKYYANKYYQEARGSYEHDYTDEELKYLHVKFEQRFEVIKKYLGGKKGRILDVGCGEGYNLAFFKEQGWTVRGIDFSSAGIESKNPECLNDFIFGDIYNILSEEISAGTTYDVILLQNVLEHVIEPVELLKTLRSIISQNGVSIITVPNDCSNTQLSALKFGHIDDNFWIVTPDHLNYFDYESLKKTTEMSGWKCLDILGDFPIDWYLYHPGSNYVKNKSLGKSAHKARVQLENLIGEQPMENVIEFWSSLAKIGFGRDITAFLMPVEEFNE